ncbi:MAG TPA: c-type cytochrome, partial [Gemmataceae bacterium]|nr:c-type cytochrome [Gemmataceae bacterium]
AITTLRAFTRPKGKERDFAQALHQVADSESGHTFDVRLLAMAAIPAKYRAEPKDHLFRQMLEALDRDQPANRRGLAAEVMSATPLSKELLFGLIAALPKVGPLELDRTLTAFAQTKDEAIGLKLVAALDAPELRPSLRVDGVKERIKHFPMTVHKAAEKLYAALNAEYEQQRVKLDEMSKAITTGDVRRGQAVFNSAKASCIACHTIGYVGGKIGPDLTKIGSLRTERDLLESILFPSASFVRSYEPLTVVTKDGRQFTGAPKKDAPDEIILVLAADKEQRIAREDIEEVRPGKVSIMPAGLDRQITPQELADLIAFLRACK